MHQHRAGAAIDQQIRQLHGLARGQQAVGDLRQTDVVQRALSWAAVLTLGAGPLTGVERMYFVRAGGTSGGDRAVEGALQAGLAQVRSGGVAKVPIHQDLAHRAFFQAALVLFGPVVAHDSLGGGLAGLAQAGPLRRQQGVAQGGLKGLRGVWHGGVERGCGRFRSPLLKHGCTRGADRDVTACSGGQFWLQSSHN